MGNLYEAWDSFEKALYYYSEFPEARQKLQEVRRVLKDHDQLILTAGWSRREPYTYASALSLPVRLSLKK